jgi:cyanophycinase
MKKFAMLYHILLSLSFIPLNANAQGHLVIIGGGDKPDVIIQKIIQLSGGSDSKIMVIPNASSEQVESATWQADQFKSFGAKNVNPVYFTKTTANDDSIMNKFNNAKCVFFCGGDQSNLTADLLGTKLLEKIKKIYSDGGVISGTSAGAAVMSKVMITGNELVNRDSTEIFNMIEKGNVETTEGFGFVTKAVIDQHFIKRKRNNRLINVILEHPDLLGIGIDESTAILVNPDETFEVLGESEVIIYDASGCRNIKLNGKNKFSADNIIMNILFAGQKFDMNKRKIIE